MNEVFGALLSTVIAGLFIAAFCQFILDYFAEWFLGL